MGFLQRSLSLLWALALAAPDASAQAVIVVDRSFFQGTDFVDLQQAIDAAPDGSFILVRNTGAGPSGLSPITIDGKSLTIVGTAVGIQATISDGEGAGITVRNLAANQSVVLRNLNARTRHPLLVEDCAGTVWIDSCSFTASGVTLPIHLEGSILVNSPHVTIQDTRFEGAFSIYVDPRPDAAGAALTLRNSVAQLYGSEVQGGIGGLANDEPGGPGLVLEGSTASCFGSTLRGGRGGSSTFGPCFDAGDGGVGVRFATPDSRLRSRATSLEGGLGGNASSACQNGADGAPFFGDPSQVLELGGVGRALSWSSPVREGELLFERYSAPAGEWILLVFGAAPSAPLPLLDGFFHLEPAAQPVTLSRGLVPASGEKFFSTTLGELGPGVEGLAAVAQPLFLNLLTLEAFTGPPTNVALLDASITAPGIP